MLTNREIARHFRLYGKLLQLHGENDFKVRGYESAAYRIERLEQDLKDLSEDELKELEGIGSGIAAKIKHLTTEGTLPDLEALEEQTPPGLMEMLGVKGLGPKRLRTLWQKLGLTNLHEVLEAAEQGALTELPGMGRKTQDKIVKQVRFAMESRGFVRLNEAVAEENHLLKMLNDQAGVQAEITGDLRRRCEVIDRMELLVHEEQRPELERFLEKEIPKGLGDKGWRTPLHGLPLHIHYYTKASKAKLKLTTTGSAEHLKLLNEIPEAETEQEIYRQVGLQYIPAEMREGLQEVDLAREKKIERLVEFSDIRGCLHNHSHYSDGKSSLRNMAEACHQRGLEYFGISDHSKSAGYAGGLTEEKLHDQWQEIETLNDEFLDLRIFRGIESDILSKGQLDYPEEILEQFDFIVASIHGNMDMKEAVATQRLIKAVENPHTTILGHMTGCLLLIRPGYPVDHEKVIDACAANGVAIEINANPRRLDIDWRWVRHAAEKGVWISLNPDAHHVSEIDYMHWGVMMARKAGLPKELILNCKFREEFEDWLKQKHARA